MSNTSNTSRLTLAHVTLAAKDLDRLSSFYCGTLGFHVTNRGEVPGGGEIAFLSQDPCEHHQIAMVSGMEPHEPAFMMVDHMAFRTGTLDDLRDIRAKLVAAKVEPILQINHGNAWSLYFNDCEGNGLECFVDTPFHVAQPFADGFDLDQSDEDILNATRSRVESEPEFQPLSEWKDAFTERLNQSD